MAVAEGVIRRLVRRLVVPVCATRGVLGFRLFRQSGSLRKVTTRHTQV